MNYVKCRVGDLFDIHPTKAYKGNNSDILSDNGTIPVVANNSTNNGIGGYSLLEPTEKGGIITFSDTTTSDSIFYPFLHELMHIWLYEKGYKNQKDGCFTFEDICDFMATEYQTHN